MNPRGKKLEPKLGIDMPFGELLSRLVRTKPEEVDRSIAKAKQKKPGPAKRKKVDSPPKEALKSSR
jgi:hypothetical protein